MHDHGWLLTCAVLLLFPVTAAAQQASPDTDNSRELRRRLRTLEAKYEETGDPKYLFERVLTLEQMGEYQFALEVVEKHREDFEADSDVDGVAVVEQRLRREIGASEDGGGATDEPSTSGGGTDVLGVSLTGVGGTALTGGLVSVLLAEHRARRLRCSPVSQGSAASGCGGIDPYTGLTQSEFQDKRRGVGTLRAVAIGLGATGVGLASWGIVRLLTPREGARAARGDRPWIRVYASWRRSDPVVGVRVDF